MKLISFSIPLLGCILSVALAQSQPTSNPTGCLEGGYSTSIDYFPHKVQPAEATGFSIDYHNTYKVVTNHNTNTSYLLYQCGTDIPQNEDLSLYSAVLSIPIDQVGLSQTVQITYIEQLGKLNNIAFFLTDPEYNSSPCFAERIKNGDVWLLRDGEPDSSSIFTDDGTSSPLVTPNGLVAFCSPFDSYINTTASRILVSEFAETTNQAIFEWLYFYSAFFNAEELANKVVAAADAEYACIKAETEKVTTDATRPEALWAYYSEYCSGWSIGKCPNYYCEFARDAGAKLIQVADDFGEIVGQDYCAGENFLTTKQIVEIGQNASHWFFMAPYWNRTYETFKDKLDTMKSVQLKQVYDYQEAGENAWYQERLAEYYDVLHDFCATVGTCPKYVGPGWFRNVFTEEIGDEGKCSDRGNRFPFTIQVCDLGGGDDQSAGSDSNDTTSSAWQVLSKAGLCLSAAAALLLM